MIAKVIIPLPIGHLYTYNIPDDLLEVVGIGKRVDVLFNKRHITGLVYAIEEHGDDKPLLSLISVLDKTPLINQDHLTLWSWVAQYYCCSLGEAMVAALPGALRIQPDTKVHLRDGWESKELLFTETEHDLIQWLLQKKELTLAEVMSVFPNKEGIKWLDSLTQREIITPTSFLKKSPNIKPYKWIEIAPEFIDNADAAFDKCKKSIKQTQALLEYFDIYNEKGAVRYDHWAINLPNKSSIAKALAYKGILSINESLSNRYKAEENIAIKLIENQNTALKKINEQFKRNKPVLLHGVTGSGKTLIYLKLIELAIENKNQILYLIPEIALTYQLVSRVKDFFQDNVYVYNYTTSVTERLRVWKKIISGEPIIILGSRSSVFLPFNGLGLIIVDEEHDNSYKQQDINPRYNARDTAIYLAQMHDVNILLGTATPSVDSYFNTKNDKYSLVELKERFGEIKMPEIQLVDLKKYAFGKQSQLITIPLINEIEKNLSANRQVIIFLNRRGFYTLTFCTNCDWRASCYQCDVSLTHHVFSSKLHCHQCGMAYDIPVTCPSCNHPIVQQKGHGTQRVEEELNTLFPKARIQRFDTDSVKGKKSYTRIIQLFSADKLDILVGTQMVTKGFDFDRVGLVGVLQGDQLLKYPDFRSVEFTYQLLTQVAGRSGRKDRQGKVIVQGYQVDHPVFDWVVQNDYDEFYRAELNQRATFGYPPYSRLINIQLRHKVMDVLNRALRVFDEAMSERLAKRSFGPAIPPVSRVRGYFIRSYMIKVEDQLSLYKGDILHAKMAVQKTKGLSGVKCIIDVDPR